MRGSTTRSAMAGSLSADPETLSADLETVPTQASVPEDKSLLPSAHAARKGTVYLVGAGPGDPELLTVRAARLLREADVVLFDDLVPAAVLDLCGPQTLRTSVGKRCGRARTTQAEIHTVTIDYARSGKSVVRLKSGDPLVFGRAAEELEALRQAGIPVEIVPGISAVFAAGAELQLPLTDRRSASKLILIAGQHAAEKTALVPIWSGPLPHDATLAIYMPGRDAGAHRDPTACGRPRAGSALPGNFESCDATAADSDKHAAASARAHDACRARPPAGGLCA